MNYTRLTKRVTAGKHDIFKEGTKYVEPLAYDGVIYARLAELEDKIEQGTLIELKNRKPLMWGKYGDTIHCQHCGEDLMGVFDGETEVIQCPKCGGFVDGLVAEDYNEEILKELQNG